MILRNVVILLIVILSRKELQIEAGCVVSEDAYDYMVCDYVYDLLAPHNGTDLRSIRFTECSDNNTNSMNESYPVMPTVRSVTFACPVTRIPHYTFQVFPKLHNVNLPKCNMSRVYWQAVWNANSALVDLGKCPVPCTCGHEWLLELSQEFTYVLLPAKFRRCLINCPANYIRADKYVVNAREGDDVSFKVTVVDQYVDVDAKQMQYFEWRNLHFHKHEERRTNDTFEIFIKNVTENDVGTIDVICWHCMHFLRTTVQLQVDRSLNISFLPQYHYDTDHLLIQGWPLDNLTLKLIHVPTNRTETHLMTDSSVSFFKCLIVSPERSPQFHKKVFKIYLNMNTDEDLLTGLVNFTVCAAEKGCQTIEKELWYLGPPPPPRTTAAPLPMASSYWKFLMIFLGICLILGIFVCFCLFCRSRSRVARFFYVEYTRARRFFIRVPNEDVQEGEELQVEHARRPSDATEETLLHKTEQISLISDYTDTVVEVIECGQIQIHDVIGRGEFGRVYRGSWDKLGENSVAIKTMSSFNEEIVKEAVIMSRLNHPNIVRLYGMTEKDKNLLLVFEYMNHGDLRRYLRERKPIAGGSYAQFPPPLNHRELKKIIVDIINGIGYLGKQQVVHRDIATRNCLVSGQSDLRATSAASRPPTIVKISDFGLSRRLQGSDYYRMEGRSLLPVRWMPAESIVANKFTHQSDIWALGVTIWEIYNFGLLPYAGVSDEVIIAKIIAGQHPEKTDLCPEAMYKLMEKCWESVPDDRISADELLLDAEFEDIVLCKPIIQIAQQICADMSDNTIGEEKSALLEVQ